MTDKELKIQAAKILGKLGIKARFKGKTKKQRSQMMREMAQIRWAKPDKPKNDR